MYDYHYTQHIQTFAYIAKLSQSNRMVTSTRNVHDVKKIHKI